MKNTLIVAGNWKMNKSPKECVDLADRITSLLSDIKGIQIILSPPFTGLNEIQLKSPFYKAAQNCYHKESGAYTGEISLNMIKDCGATHIIVGHSERRSIFNEENDFINHKVLAAIKNEIVPILCIGESLHERENGLTEKTLYEQLMGGLKGLSILEKIVVAYEPVWAIGTGVSANKDQVEQAHNYIRKILNSIDNKHYTPILYGGSVKPDNSNELINITEVGGFLVGGASLDADSFVSIVNEMRKIRRN
tara:strand:+ start:2256 stop:3005 length:750 start_codon:yes stop_codon:yes gene_type:complete